MCSVTVAVASSRIIVHKVIAIGGASAELRVGDTDACINHISRDTATSIVVSVCSAQGKLTLIDPIQPPRWRGLRCVQGDLLICFDELDIWIMAESLNCLIGEAAGKT